MSVNNELRVKALTAAVNEFNQLLSLDEKKS